MEPDGKIQVFEPAGEELEQIRPVTGPVWEATESEPAPDLLSYWRVIRKRRWTVMTVLFVLFTLVLIGTLRQQPVFRGRTLLEIQKENPDVASLQELFELESVSDTYLETQYKVLASESLARRVIEQVRLDRIDEFNPPPPWWSSKEAPAPPAAPVPGVLTAAEEERERQVRQRVLEVFQSRLGVEPVKRSRLVSVSFESTDPELAARVVNTLASNYIDLSLEARWNATQKATEWLSQQLLGLKIKVEKSEEDLQRYARANGLLFLESKEGQTENIITQRLRQLQEEMTRAQASRYEKESLYRLVQSGETSALPGLGENKVIQDLTVRLAELEREHAQISATFSPDYPRVKQIQSQLDELTKVLEREKSRAVARVVNDYQAALRREELVRSAFEAQQQQADQVAERSVQYNILKREVETNKQLYEGLLQRLKEASVSAGLKASNIRIVDPAEPPREAVKPRVLLNLSLGLVLGLLIGTASAFLQEYLDNTLKTPEHVERLLRVPALAMIPSANSVNGRAGVYGLLRRTNGRNGEESQIKQRGPRWYRIDATGADRSVLSEAFRGLRTSVLLSTPDHPPATLLVTSAQPAEGKTTISCNLAISLAQLGQKVLLVDCDMRRPSVHRLFNLNNDRGLVNFLTGQQDWREVVQNNDTASLDCLPCGPIPPNPAELLSSQRMRTLLLEARESYQFVVLDSPPILSVTDSRILATLVEGVILVAKAGSTPREMVQRAHASMRGGLIGLVLNNLDVRTDDYYYGGGYNYGAYNEPVETAHKEES